jgi:DNA-binding transcriptional MerR regulator
MNTVAVSQRTGFTVRQLQYMDERGVVVPEIKRHARIYRPAQVRFLFLLRRLVDKGFLVPPGHRDVAAGRCRPATFAGAVVGD